MPRPETRYCTTADGVSIAYWVMGDGPPMVYLPPLAQASQLDWDFPHMRQLYEWMMSRHRVVRVEPRNVGLSDRGVDDVSIAARCSDVQAVVDRLDLEPFTLWGHGTNGEVAAAYAAAHPDRVARLIVVNATIRFPGVSMPSRIAAMLPLIDSDWETYTEVLSGLVWGWADQERRPAYAELLRQSQTQEDAIRHARRVAADDVAGMLSQIRAPTLVVHHRDALATSADTGRRIAAAIPDARLVTLEGGAVGVSGGDARTQAAVEEFEGSSAPAASQVPPSGIMTVLFTDLVGHTEMMRRLGDAHGRDVLREHERITRDVLKQHDGREIKTDGDSFMVSFASVTRAVDCAIALQQAFAAFALPPPLQDERLGVRVGLNAGEPIEEDGDLFGSTVILASRICAQAEAGEILIPEPLRHLLTGKRYVYADRGERVLKGFEDALRLYEVRWEHAT